MSILYILGEIKYTIKIISSVFFFFCFVLNADARKFSITQVAHILYLSNSAVPELLANCGPRAKPGTLPIFI